MVGVVPNDDMIHGPRWRTRTTPERRARLALVTFVVVVAVGLIPMIGAIWLISSLGAPTFVNLLPWLVPTAAVVTWALVRPSVAEPTDDDEQTWPGFAIRYVIVGETRPRPRPARAVAAIVFGGPIGWSVVLIGALVIVGLA